MHSLVLAERLQRLIYGEENAPYLIQLPGWGVPNPSPFKLREFIEALEKSEKSWKTRVGKSLRRAKEFWDNK